MQLCSVNCCLQQKLEYPHETSKKQSSRSGGRSSRKSRHREPPEISFLDELNLSEFTPRWTIYPNDSKTITVTFSANIECIYKDTFFTSCIRFSFEEEESSAVEKPFLKVKTTHHHHHHQHHCHKTQRNWLLLLHHFN